MDDNRAAFLRDEFAKIKITLSDLQTSQFLSYYELLVEWNAKMNLTAITEYEDVVIKHFVDSVSSVLVYDYKKVHHLLDLGTGAGFPGIPLKIIYPEINVTLVDSLNKRVNFLNEVISELGLKKITAIHGRAEDLARDLRYREKQDLVVSRAVANLSVLLEYCMPFVRPGGCFISYKSGKYREELESSRKACMILCGKLIKEVPFTLPETDIERSFLVFKKTQKLSQKYPRKAGLPAKQPLGSR